MNKIYNKLFTILLSLAAIVVSSNVVVVKANAATVLIPNFQRGNLGDKWYADRVPGTNDPIRETYHARNPQADPDAVKDGWWKDANFTDWFPKGWVNDPRFDGNKHDYGFAQVETFLYRQLNSGVVKVLADASGKSVQKRVKATVTVPEDGKYRFQSWAWFSQYNGEIITNCGGTAGLNAARNVHLAMEVAVNGAHVAEPNVKCPVRNTWQELKHELNLKKNDVVKITLVTDQKNTFSGSLFDAYFTLPEGGTGVKL